MKRTPLLFDQFMANTKPQLEMERKPFEFLRNRMVGAHVFTLDHEATRYMANMIQAHPEAIALDQEFAIPPFKKMFVEFPYPEFFTIMGGHHRGDGSEDERRCCNPALRHRSISPNTMSIEPSTADTSASIWPRQRKSMAARWGKLGALILQR